MDVIEKPWGKEEIIEVNDKYMVKRLTMFEGHRCSLQYHNIKQETIFVLSGKLRIYFGNSMKVFLPEEYITIPPKIVHRMEAIENTVYLEMSTPEIRDVVRLGDSYGRV